MTRRYRPIFHGASGLPDSWFPGSAFPVQVAPLAFSCSDFVKNLGWMLQKRSDSCTVFPQ